MGEDAPAPPRLPLRCPGCGEGYGSETRFCGRCGLPLVLDAPAAEEVSDRHGRARKIKPQLSEGSLLSVARARNQAEAEFIQALLLEEGVPSLLRRSAGFDVPDFLAAGPRDVLVAQSGFDTARQVLLEADILSPTAESQRRPVVAPGPLLAGMMLALAVGGVVVALLWLVLR